MGMPDNVRKFTTETSSSNSGPSDTPYEGGIFAAIMKFPPDYPLNPPKMKFTSEMWHPNGIPISLCLQSE